MLLIFFLLLFLLCPAFDHLSHALALLSTYTALLSLTLDLLPPTHDSFLVPISYSGLLLEYFSKRTFN